MIGILGGTGDFGQGLAARLRAVGEEVVLGSRTPRDEFVSNAEACRRGDIVFLSIPPGGIEEMCTDLASELSGCIAVSVASPIVFRAGRPAAEPGELSLAELAQQAAPRAHVVAALHTVSAKILAEADRPLDEDVLVCADDEDARTVVCDLLDRIVAGRVVDCGRLEVARWIEPLTAVLLNVNRRYKANTGIRVTGIG